MSAKTNIWPQLISKVPGCGVMEGASLYTQTCVLQLGLTLSQLATGFSYPYFNLGVAFFFSTICFSRIL